MVTEKAMAEVLGGLALLRRVKFEPGMAQMWASVINHAIDSNGKPYDFTDREVKTAGVTLGTDPALSGEWVDSALLVKVMVNARRAVEREALERWKADEQTRIIPAADGVPARMWTQWLKATLAAYERGMGADEAIDFAYQQINVERPKELPAVDKSLSLAAALRGIGGRP